MADTIYLAFLFSLWALPVVAIFTAMALLASLIELYLEWRNRP